MAHQKTIARPKTTSGVGIHSGNDITLTLQPAPIDHGIVFQRVDLDGQPRIPADVNSVSATALATTLGSGEARVGTVEHLLSAAAALRVDNLLVQVDGAEVPVLDGSAKEFCKLIREGGITIQAAPRRYMVVTGSVRVEEGDRFVEVSPYPVLTIDATIEFDHPSIGTQHKVVSFENGQFEKEIADARTFGFLREVRMLQKSGFARGGALYNAVVIGDAGPINHGGWKYPDEAVRHKILDLLGDIALLGMPLVGYVRAFKPGHALHHKFAKAVLENKDAWTVMTAAEVQSHHGTGKSAPDSESAAASPV